MTVCGRIRTSNAYDAAAWAPCDNVTSNVRARIGGATVSTSCDDATGEFAFTAPVVAGALVVIWVDHLTDRAASYLRVDGTRNQTDLLVGHVNVDTFTAASITNA